MLLFIQPTSRIATAAFLVMATLFGVFPFLQKLFADDGYQGPQVNALAKTLVHVNLKSSNDRIRRSASNLCPNAGLSNATLFDSIDAADLPRIGRTSIARRSLPVPRFNPPHAQKTLQSSLKSPDRLLRSRIPGHSGMIVSLTINTCPSMFQPYFSTIDCNHEVPSC